MTEATSRDFRIRDALPKELDDVSSVMSAAYHEYSDSFPADLWEDYANNIADVRSRFGDSELIVAERDERIVGAVTFYPERSPSGWPDGWAGIRLVAVHPDSRRQRIGQALTQECIRRSRERGIATVGLHTTGPMLVARGMYEKMGFSRVPEFDHHPHPSFVVMAFRLDL